MNLPPLFAQLMFFSLLLLLCGCQRPKDVAPPVIVEKEVPIIENMTDAEWLTFRNKSIDRLVNKYLQSASDQHADAEISILPLESLSSPPKAEIHEKLAPLPLESLSSASKNKKLEKLSKIDKYSELQIQPEAAVGKKYKVPPNEITGGNTPQIKVPDIKPEPTAAICQKKSSEAREQAKAKNNYDFIWPVKGRVVLNYGDGPKGFNNGINIHTHTGTSVLAVKKGTVLYVGNAIKELGNIILVRHDDDWVSAYAHVQNITVKKDEVVTQGQPIAHVEGSAKEKSEFHFEIRKGRKSFDPLNFLPKD